MSVRYTKKSIRVNRLRILICVVLALVVGTIAYSWVTQGRFPLAPAVSQAGSEPVSSQQNSTAGISPALESSASADSGSSFFAVMNALTYANKEYGFTFTLPQGFEGYTILSEEQKGIDIKNIVSKAWVFEGPQIITCDPRRTSQIPHQDISIMILTVDQWNQLRNGELSIRTVPVSPSELGQNSGYVLALPARYNYALPGGYEEVQTILDGSPPATFEPTPKKQV